MSRSTFIRFGDLPERGLSVNNVTGEQEDGVSGFRAKEKADGSLMLTPCDAFAPEVFLARPCYIVEAYEVGTGADGEPLFRAEDARLIPARVTNPEDSQSCWVIEEIA